MHCNCGFWWTSHQILSALWQRVTGLQAHRTNMSLPSACCIMFPFFPALAAVRAGVGCGIWVMWCLAYLELYPTSWIHSAVVNYYGLSLEGVFLPSPEKPAKLEVFTIIRLVFHVWCSSDLWVQWLFPSLAHIDYHNWRSSDLSAG